MMRKKEWKEGREGKKWDERNSGERGGRGEGKKIGMIRPKGEREQADIRSECLFLWIKEGEFEV
jgi:hypothetical protein